MRALLLAAAGVFVACAGPAPGRPGREQAPPPRPVKSPVGRALAGLGFVEVPLARADSENGGAWYVEATVNGAGVRLVLDTGAARTAIDQVRAAAIGVKPRAAATGPAFGAAEVRIVVSEPTRVGVAGLAFETRVHLIDFRPVNAAYRANDLPQMDGVLGDNFLRWFGAVIDYPGACLYLRPPATGAGR